MRFFFPVTVASVVQWHSTVLFKIIRELLFQAPTDVDLELVRDSFANKVALFIWPCHFAPLTLVGDRGVSTNGNPMLS